MNEQEIYRACMEKWQSLQYFMVIEEFSEVTKAIIKRHRHQLSTRVVRERYAKELIEEAVDAELMLNQLRFMLNYEWPELYAKTYGSTKRQKLSKLEQMLNE